MGHVSGLYAPPKAEQNRVLPKVFITPEAKRALDTYIDLCPLEISGLGKVMRVGKIFLVYTVELFAQEVTAGSTDLDTETLQKFLLEIVKAGGNPEEYKLWWHSHVNGGCHWSQTDEDTCDRFKNGWMLSVVANKHGEYLARLDIYEPVRITLDRLQFEVRAFADDELIAKLKEEVAAKVHERPVLPGPAFVPGPKFVARRKRYYPGAVLPADQAGVPGEESLGDRLIVGQRSWPIDGDDEGYFNGR